MQENRSDALLMATISRCVGVFVLLVLVPALGLHEYGCRGGYGPNGYPTSS
jgi:hypothetical protein